MLVTTSALQGQPCATANPDEHNLLKKAANSPHIVGLICHNLPFSAIWGWFETEWVGR